MDTTTALALGIPAAAFAGSFLTYLAASRANKSNSLLRFNEQLQANEKAAHDRAERIQQQAEDDIKDMGSRVAGLQTQVDELQTKLRAADRLVDEMTDRMAMVQQEVWRPEPDVDALRRLVGRPSGSQRWPNHGDPR